EATGPIAAFEGVRALARASRYGGQVMKKSLLASGLVVLLSSLFGAACGDGLDNSADAVATDPSQLTLCRNIAESLRDRPATVYHVTYSPDILAVDIDGEIVCADTTSEVIQTGLIAVPPVIAPSCVREGFCDGSPLPAEQFNLAVRLHLWYLPMVYIF